MTNAVNPVLQARPFVNRRDLELVLARRHGHERRIAEFSYRPSPYASSHGLFEMDIVLADGTVLRLLNKDVGANGLLEAARQAKPPLLQHPTREVEMYRAVLSDSGVAIPTYYGILVNHQQQPRSLILERIRGLELRRVGDFRHWKQAVRLLGLLHIQATNKVASLSEEEVPPLLRYDTEFYWEWPMRAVENAARAGTRWPRDAEARIIQLARRYDQVVDYLIALPVSVIHGDCFPSNVLLKTEPDQGPLYFVDWEMAASGPGLMDVAALTAGAWTELEQRELLLAYREALETSGGTAPSLAELLRALDYCRLHLAIQFLGWSPEWAPPSEQAQDWLGEALRLADKLEL